MNRTAKIIVIIVCAAVVVAAGVLCMIFLPKQNQQAKPEEAAAEQLQGLPSLKELLEQKEELVIDCLGDSITWGMYSTPTLKKQIADGEIETGPDDGGQMNDDYGIYVSGAFQSDPSYPEVLEAELNRMLKEQGSTASVKTVNDGICGDWITEKSYQRMTCDPDVVIILMGGNNYYFDIPIAGMHKANVDALRKQGIPVFFVNYPTFPKEPHEIDFVRANQQMEMVADMLHVPLFDAASRFEELVYKGEGEAPEGMYLREDLFSPDRIHLSEKGYELLGDFAAEELFKYMQE